MKKVKGLFSLKKELKEITNGNMNKYNFKVVIYTSYDGEKIISDLDVEIFRNEEYIEGVNCRTIEDKENDTMDFWEIVDNHRFVLSKDKKAIYNSLFKDYGDKVVFGEDYTQ